MRKTRKPKKMKKLYIAAGLLIAFHGYSQSAASKKADALFESYQYTRAIEEYKSLIGKDKGDAHTYKQLADSYYAIFNMDEAARWYAKATETSQDAEAYYRYAVALRSQGNYPEANRQMDTFARLNPNDARAKEHKANPDYIPALSGQDKLFEIQQSGINDKTGSDFGAVLGNDSNLYFVSTRSSGKTDSWNQSYIDIYRATRNSDGSLSEATAISELNTAYHDGPVAISADGNTIYFARDGRSAGQYKKEDKAKVGQQGLYKATKADGKWGSISALPVNSTEYSVGSPSISKDGRTLYFASNMPGGLGDTDIWKVTINADGTYGTPENLGPKVNTAGKENFPFITDDNILYFSSLSRQGLGGYDIFRIDLTTGSEAINAGKPVNSEKDDFSFSYNTAKGVGYFSSNREGSDNIYIASPVCRVEAVSLVIDRKTGQVIADAKVSILDNKQNKIESKQSNSKGEVSYAIDCDTEYVLQAEKQGYEPGTFAVAKTAGGQVKVTAELVPVEVLITDTHVMLKDIHFEYNKSNITQQGAHELDKLVKVMNDNPAMVIMVKSHTDTKGSAAYNMKLSAQRAQSTVEYVISKGISKSRISGKGYGESEPKVDCGEGCTDSQNAENRRSEFMIIKK